MALKIYMNERVMKIFFLKSRDIIIYFFAVFLFFGCSEKFTGSGTPVAIVNGIDNGAFLDTVQLQTLQDLHALQGQYISMRSQTNLDLMELLDLSKKGGFETFQTFYEHARQQVVSEPVHPNLLWQSSRWVPQDFDSLMMVSAYAHLEEIMAFFRNVVGDQSGATKNPFSIGFYSTVRFFGKLDPQGLSANASYSYLPDMLFLLRPGSEKWLSYGLHKTVLAHEFTHRFFHYNVWVEQLETQTHFWRAPDKILADITSQTHYYATDEGLADLVAILFTGDPSALGYAFHGTPNGLMRDLQGPFAQEATYDKLVQINKPFAEEWKCHYSGGLPWDQMQYCLGTVLARTVLDAASPGGSTGEKIAHLRNSFAPLLRRFCKMWGKPLRKAKGSIAWVFSSTKQFFVCASRVMALANSWRCTCVMLPKCGLLV